MRTERIQGMHLALHPTEEDASSAGGDVADSDVTRRALFKIRGLLDRDGSPSEQNFQQAFEHEGKPNGVPPSGRRNRAFPLYTLATPDLPLEKHPGSPGDGTFSTP